MMDGEWKCDRCGDAIGVYEPLILVNAEGEALRTSRAADPEQGPGAGYHEACWLDADAGAS